MSNETIRASDLKRARLIVGEDVAHPVSVSGHFSLKTGERLGIPHEPEECSNVRCILESTRD